LAIHGHRQCLGFILKGFQIRMRINKLLYFSLEYSQYISKYVGV